MTVCEASFLLTFMEQAGFWIGRALLDVARIFYFCLFTSLFIIDDLRVGSRLQRLFSVFDPILIDLLLKLFRVGFLEDLDLGICIFVLVG